MHTEAVFENIANRIETEIDKAQKSVIIAVAWFTNKNLFETIIRKSKKGCQISLMITDDEINNNSGIDYNRLNTANSKIYKIGNGDKNLMHNKFCVIDFSTVITGSYNWSYKAESNHENIVVNYEDLALAKQFVNEFNYIKSLYFTDISKEEPKQDFPLDVIVKRLEVLRNFIVLEDFEDISHTAQKLKKFEEHSAIKKIVELTEKQLFGEAMELIGDFISQYQQLAVWNDPEIDGLKLEIKILENQINAFENEKNDLEKTINDFQYQHTKELGELILEILKLRKQKLKNEEAENDYNQYQKQYDNEMEKEVLELTEDEKKELKKQYKNASILCHPDKFMNESLEVQKQAEELFKELNEANAKNDLKRVEEILNNLKNGILTSSKSDTITDKERLRETINRLNQKLQKIEQELNGIKQSEIYQKLCEITDWNDYFAQNKELLQKELEELQNG